MPDVEATSRWAPLVGHARRHRRLIAIWAVAGLLLGALWALVAPATHVAESKLLVGTFEAPSAAIPGYVLASQTVAANYARLASSTAVTDKLREQLGEDPSSYGATITVKASPSIGAPKPS